MRRVLGDFRREQNRILPEGRREEIASTFSTGRCVRPGSPRAIRLLHFQSTEPSYYACPPQIFGASTETFFYSDITDSEHNATIHTGKDLKSKTRWDHDVLKVTTTESGAITLESYTLAADGAMLVSVERPEHKPITLVFQRK